MIEKYKDKFPKIHNSCFIAASAEIYGDVVIKENSNIWFGVVIRGDVNSIHIGEGTNIQDNCTLHVNTGLSKLSIGEYVTVGHNAILHGCKIGNCSLIGMGSIILDDAEIGEETIIGAGSLVTSNKKIPSGVLCLGSPAKVIRELTQQERRALKASALHYIELAEEYK